MEDYDEDDENECPYCHHSPIRRRECTNIHCENGFEDMYEDDPINHPEPDQDLVKCSDCDGTGFEVWCPNCGHELSDKSFD